MADIDLLFDNDPSLVLDEENSDIELEESAPAGGGGGGTKDYNQLENKPSLNGVTIEGELTTEDVLPEIADKADKTDTVLLTTLSRGRQSHTEVGSASYAFGNEVVATGDYSHAEGSYTVSSGENSHTEGYMTEARGNNSHAEGYMTLASGFCSHVEGVENEATGSYSHSEGDQNHATAYCAHAEGALTTASAEGSHSEGYNTQANGIYAHAEGTASQSSGYGSHAEGGVTKAQGSNSHSEGYNTSAKGTSSHAEGSIQLGNETKTYSGTTYSRGANGTSSHSEGMDTVAHGDQSHAEGYDTLAKAQYSHAEGNGTVASETGSHAEGGGTISSGAYSHSEGSGTHATAFASHSEGGGTTASGTDAHAEGGGTTASGDGAHSEGFGTQATSYASHSEGSSTEATGSSSHAEGSGTHATGPMAHAEGSGTHATGSMAHAEGGSTHANAPMSHAEGGNTVAAGTCSHVGGTMNVEDSYDNWPEWVSGSDYSVGDKVKITTTSGNDTTITAYICKTPNSDTTFTAYKWDNQQGKMNYAEIIGNGISSRSNARALDWDGNEYLKGNLYVGCESDSTGGNKVATESFVTGKVGSANGIAGLDSAGKVPVSQLPSYVDDVLEYASISEFPVAGETGKIYVALDTNKTYRWGGTAYVQISESLALGETEQTAYRGDRGKAAYDHAVLKGTEHTAGFYKFSSNSEGHVATATPVAKADLTGLGVSDILSIAPAYTSTTYTAGDRRTHEGKLYKANQDIGTAEDWTPGHWTETDIVAEIAAAVNVTELYRQFWNSTDSVSVELSADGKTYNIWSAGSSAGTSGAIADQTYGCDVFVSNGQFIVRHKGSAITVSESSGVLTISSTDACMMAIVEV